MARERLRVRRCRGDPVKSEQASHPSQQWAQFLPGAADVRRLQVLPRVREVDQMGGIGCSTSP